MQKRRITVEKDAGWSSSADLIAVPGVLFGMEMS
jgi:hypothetical protein